MPSSSSAAAGAGNGGVGGQRQMNSGSSTPTAPENEAERNELEHQQEVDLHLATSMSRGLDLVARSRSRSGGDDMHGQTQRGNVDPYRRDVQAEQDAHFFEGSASPRSRAMMQQDHQRTPPSPSTAAARFYRQNRRRTLSDTSVDSQAGFIDHRGSQASMPIRGSTSRANNATAGNSGVSTAGGDHRHHLSPRDIVRSAARTRSSRLKSELQHTGASPSPAQQQQQRTRQATSASEEDEEDLSGEDNEPVREEENMHAGPSSGGGNLSKSRARRGTGISTLSATKPSSSPEDDHLRERRRPSFDMPDEDFDSHDLQGSALATGTVEDEPGVVDHRMHHHTSSSRRSPVSRDFLHRQDSRRSDNSRSSRQSDLRDHRDRRRHDEQSHSDHEETTAFSPSLSRRPSDIGKVEEDVCYPMLQMRDAEMGERGDSPPRATDSRMAFHSARGQLGIPGVLPNFPFPFDFAALEDYAGEEREREGIAIPKAKKANGNAIDVPGISTSASPGAGKAISFSPDTSDGGRMMRRRKNGDGPSRRQRKLSESVSHVSRYQRKLALFEGSSPDQRNDDKAAGADSKTPLLSDQSKSRPGFGATNHRSAASGSEKVRPYRFSFYSNALPSTIHARSLAEIPGEDQTFEELFVGRQQESPAPEEWEGSVVDAGEAQGLDAFLPAQKPGSTGQNTPNLGVNAPSVASFKQAGNASGRSSGHRHESKPRTNLIRSVEDAEANTWWLDVLCPTDAEMKVLGKVFGIHPLTIEDILMEEAREKIELFRNYYFVCFRSFDQDPYSPTYLEPLNMYVIVFREGTLSFHFRGTPHPQNVRRRIKQLKDFINVTSDWISYALIDDITDAFGPLIQNIEYEVDSIDELVLILKDAEQSDMLRRIGTCRKKVMGLLRLMGNKADVVKGLAKRCNENWSVAPKSDIGLYLSDIQDHLITMTQNLNHYEKILSRSHSNYLAQISIEMTDANNQINDVLSKLTALGTVLIPMNLVTGLWGMNVRVPGEGIENLHWFFGIVACLLAFALAGGYGTYRAFSK